MKLSRQIKIITDRMKNGQSLAKFCETLNKSAKNYSPVKENPLSEVIVNVNRIFNSKGVFPLKFNATYWSQSKQYQYRHVELSWQRCDLIYHNNLAMLKVSKS